MDKFKNLLSLQNKYKKILLDDGGLRTLCNALTDEIGKAVFILDKHKENLLYIDRELRKKENEFFEYLNKRELKNINEDVMDFQCECSENIIEYKYLFNNKESRILEVKLGDKEELGFLSIILEDTELNLDTCYAIMQASNAISIKLHQNNLIQKLASKCSNELINDILTGKISCKKELIKRSELAGWDLTVSYQLFIIRFDSQRVKKDNKNGTRSLYTYELEEKVITSLHRVIRSNISRKYIIFSYNGDILLLIHYPTKDQNIKKEGKKICKKLESKFNNLKIMIGVGCYIEDCLDIPQSYQQGLYTLNFLEESEHEAIFYYEDLGVLKLLWRLNKDELTNFAQEHLKELLEYDRNNNSKWVETLGAYLKNNSSLQESANELHIHPNTMSYRIKRIQDILDTDLQKFENKLNLAISFKIYKHIANKF